MGVHRCWRLMAVADVLAGHPMVDEESAAKRLDDPPYG